MSYDELLSFSANYYISIKTQTQTTTYNTIKLQLS